VKKKKPASAKATGRPEQPPSDPTAHPGDEINPVLLARIKSMCPAIAPAFADLCAPPADLGSSKKTRFLEAFVLTGGNVCRAAMASQTAVRTHFRWLKADPKYKAAFKAAEPYAAQILEDEARRRAFEGTLKGVYYQGQLVDFELLYSDNLLSQLLKARHPDHKPEIKVTGAGKDGAVAVEVTREDLSKVPEGALLEQIKVLRETLEWVKITTATPAPDAAPTT
jgi:hypothetical protein